MAELQDEMLPAVPDVQILRLQPGDTLVITSPVWLSDQQVDEIKTSLKERFPGHQALLLDGGATLSVLRKEG